MTVATTQRKSAGGTAGQEEEAGLLAVRSLRRKPWRSCERKGQERRDTSVATRERVPTSVAVRGACSDRRSDVLGLFHSILFLI